MKLLLKTLKISLLLSFLASTGLFAQSAYFFPKAGIFNKQKPCLLKMRPPGTGHRKAAYMRYGHDCIYTGNNGQKQKAMPHR